MSSQASTKWFNDRLRSQARDLPVKTNITITATKPLRPNHSPVEQLRQPPNKLKSIKTATREVAAAPKNVTMAAFMVMDQRSEVSHKFFLSNAFSL